MGTVLIIPLAVRDGRERLASLAARWRGLLADDRIVRLRRAQARMRLLRRAESLEALQPSFAADLRAAVEADGCP